MVLILFLWYSKNAIHLDHSIPAALAVVPAAQNEQSRKHNHQESNASSPETQLITILIVYSNAIIYIRCTVCLQVLSFINSSNFAAYLIRLISALGQH